MARLKKAVVTVEGDELKFAIEGGEVYNLHLDNLSDDVKYKALIHGLKQKVCDSYAGVSLPRDVGEAISNVIVNLQNGTWNGGRSTTGGIWVEALARAADVALDEAAEKWNGMSDEVKKDVKANVDVKRAKAEIELERARAKAGNGVKGLKLEDLLDFGE